MDTFENRSAEIGQPNDSFAHENGNDIRICNDEVMTGLENENNEEDAGEPNVATANGINKDIYSNESGKIMLTKFL